MDDKVIQELFARQGQVIATLALRISVLERLLLNKKILTEADVVEEMTALSKDFKEKTQEALRKAAEESNKERT
jgi:hypothetical protein